MQARNRLWQHWRQEHPDNENMAALFELPLMLRQPEQMPYIAPHLIEQIARQNRFSAEKPQTVVTTLDVNLQRIAEKQVAAFIARRQQAGLHNAAVLLVDTRDMGVRALVGSADYYNTEIHGQVNGTNAKRSPLGTETLYLRSRAGAGRTASADHS